MKLKSKSARPRRASWPAIQLFSDGDSEVDHYLTAIPAKKLFPVCFVSRAEEDPKKGFQRTLSEKRATAIAAYLDDGNIIPGAIILSAKDAADLVYDARTRTISFNETPKAFFVIDGQHRLFGSERATSKVTLAVSILTALDETEEARYFNDINGEQRGVPATLQLEIQKFTKPKDSPEQLRIRIFHELNTRPDSPLAGRLSATKSVTGKLTHVPFKNAVQPLLTNNAHIKGLKEEKVIQLFINFLSALGDVLVEGTDNTKKLSNAAFFQAVFYAFPGILQQVLMKHQNVRKEAFKDVLAPLAKIEWQKHSGTNKKAIQELTQHIVELLATGAKISDDKF